MSTFSNVDAPPAKAEAKVYANRGGRPCCGACKRTIGNFDQWRCPYVGCRAWLYGTEKPPKRGPADHA